MAQNDPTQYTPNYSNNYNYSQPNINGSNVSPISIGGQNTGGYNMPDYSSLAKTQNQNSQNFFNGQLGTVGAFQGAQQAAVNALPTFQQLNQQANDQYNVPNLQNTATQLNNTVLQIPKTYSDLTTGSDTNATQLQSLIGQKQWELDPLAQAATNSAQTAQGLANTSVGYGVQNEAQQLSPFTTAAPLVQNTLASQATGFTQSQADQLAALNTQVQAGVTLSGDQMAQLSALQQAKYQYDGAVAAANATVNAAKAYSQYHPVSAGQSLYNAATNTYTPTYYPS